MTPSSSRSLFNLLTVALLSVDFHDVNADVLRTVASCRAVLWSHEFDGDCCALTDLPNGGCQLEVVDGTSCNITGPVWETNISTPIATTRALCPVTAYNPLGGCKTNLDCPTKFCGADGNCHDYSCQAFFELSPVMDFDNETKTELVCEPMPDQDHHIAQYGCVETVGGLVPEARGIGIKANEVCSGISKNVENDEIIAFECFQLMQGTNFSTFIQDAQDLKDSGNATCLAPLFWYSASYGITEYSNGQLVQNKIAGDGSPPSLSFDEERAYQAMYALVTKTPTGNGGSGNGNGGSNTASPMASPTGTQSPASSPTRQTPTNPNVQDTSSASTKTTTTTTLVVATLVAVATALPVFLMV